ncbi:ATP-binding protein [Streptomyces sp. NPDC042638]|uniref:ATP-binding protein n=1 Tax=Streptomyces sp. NPDC042638 TaxID=3154333 RepID=UPI0033E085E4
MSHPGRPSFPVRAERNWRLPHSPRSAGRARALVRAQLAEWKVATEIAETAELLLPELMSNAIQHARRPSGREIGVRVARYDGRLRVEVADANCALPQARTATTEDEHGRGLAIVIALAVSWGCCPRRYGIGEATWAELELPPSA